MINAKLKKTTRRNFAMGSVALAGLVVSACAGSSVRPVRQARFALPRFGRGVDGTGISKQEYTRIYGPLPDEEFPVPAVDLEKVPQNFWRRRVPFSGEYAPGTLVVDTASFYLYHVEKNGTAMRYGVGLGRQGFEWSGKANIAWKRAWPTWTPPEEMIERQPELAKYSAENGGKPAGLDNPLGARALYIHQNGVDTLYRIHGTPEYWTIGKAVSSGCVRMMNQDVIHLYEYVANGSPIIVR